MHLNIEMSISAITHYLQHPLTSRRQFINQMELYHRTLLHSNNHHLAQALHLEPIKPKEQHDKARQLLLATTNTLELYHYNTAPNQHLKYQLKLFHTQQLFASISAVEVLEYEDQELRKDIVIVSLSNGKYELLEWMPSKSHFSAIDQGLIFSSENQVELGFAKPVPGQYIAVNNTNKLVLIASLMWDFKVYERKFGFQGMRLETLCHFRKEAQIQKISICMQLAAGQGNSLFFSLRSEMKENQKVRSVYKMKRNEGQFQEERVQVQDNTVHMLIPRLSDNSFFLVGEKNVHYTHKGKLVPWKIPQPKGSLFSTWWRRPLRQKREQYFLLNEHGELIIVNFDEGSNSPCSIHFVELIAPVITATPLERNLFFLLTAGEDHLIVETNGKYKCEDRIEKTRSSSKLKEEKEREEIGKNVSRQFQIVGTMPGGKMVKDMKICNAEGSMNNQILLTGGNLNSKKGFLSIIRYGLKLKSITTANCASPVGMWSIKKHVTDKYHSYVVLTYASRKTLTFHHDSGNNKMVQTNDLRLSESDLTIDLTRFGDNSLVQVSPFRIKYVTKEGASKQIGIKGRVMKATGVDEGRQLVTALIGGDLEYYQMVGSQLRKQKSINSTAQANNIEFSPPDIVQHRPFSKFIAASLNDYHVKIYAVVNKKIELVNQHNFKCGIQSLVFVMEQQGRYCLHIGGHYGKFFKWIIKAKTGETVELIQDSVGDRSIKLFKMSVCGKPAIFRGTPQPQLTYEWQGQTQSCTLPLPPIELTRQLNFQNFKGTIFATHWDGYLRLFQAYGFDSLLYTTQKSIELTGKKILILQDKVGVLTEGKTVVDDKLCWTSKFMILNPLKEYQVESNINFAANDKVLSLTYLSNKEKDDKNYLCFGCCNGHRNFPTPQIPDSKNKFITFPESRFPAIRIYSFQSQEGKVTITHLFNFQLDYPPLAMDAYFNKLLVGVGQKLFLFDIYKQKLVSRAISDKLLSPICTIHVNGQKIFITQRMESFTLLKVNHKNKCFDVIGQDSLSRFSVCACLVDGEGGLMAGGDKFGNFYASRLTQKIKADFEEIKEISLTENATAPNFMESMVGYHLGQIPTSIQNGSVDIKKSQCIYYTTIDGKVGMFYPMEGDDEEQLILLRKLQKEMSKSSLSGATNHKQFRNFYNPCKGVVDGDFCELFHSLSQQEKTRISANVSKQPRDISNLLAFMQSKFS